MASVDIGSIIDVLLKEYPPSMRFLKRGEYVKPNTLTAYLEAKPNWAYVGNSSEDSPVNHFTLGEAVFAHNQMAYAIFTSMANAGNIRGIKTLSVDDVNSKKFNKMLVTKFDVEFHKPIVSSREFRGEFRIDKHKIQKTSSGTYVFTKNSFSFEEGKAFGSSAAVIELENNEMIR